MNKRGLSDVVTTVLIILFAIVAVAIIGGIVLNQVNKAGEKVKSQQLCLTNNVEVLNCMQVGTEARVKYRRATDNDIKSVQDLKVGLAYTDGNNANPISGESSLGAGEVRIIKFTNVPSDKEVSSAFVASTFSAADGSKPTCVSPKISCVKGSVAGDFDSAGLQAATLTGSASNCNNNGIIESPEQCDGTNLGSATCVNLNQGFTGGTLSCSSCVFDTSACTPQCGDNVLEPPEQCDGNNLNGQDCVSQGFIGGTLNCYPSSAGARKCTFDTSQCHKCGNDVIDAAIGEQCDGSNLNGQDCVSQGYSSGILACYSASDANKCRFNFGSCTGSLPCTSCLTWGAWSPEPCISGQPQTRSCATYPGGCTAPSTPLTESRLCSAGGSWFDSAWNYRRQVDIQNPTATPYTGLALEVTTNKPANMATDCSDLRITAADGITELPFFIYDCGSTLDFYVNLPTFDASSTTTIYMYYGSSGATSKSAPNGVLSDSSHGFTASAQSAQSFERGLVFQPTQDVMLVSATIPSSTSGNLLTLYTWKNVNQPGQTIKTASVSNSIGYFNTKLSASKKYILSLKKNGELDFNWDAFLGISLPKEFNKINYLNGWQLNGGDTNPREVYNIKGMQWAPALPFTPVVSVGNELSKSI